MSTSTIAQPCEGRFDSTSDAVYRKVGWRLIPLLFLCYIVAYLDRVNVGFAKLQMQGDLRLSDAVYGLGAASSSSATSCSRCRATWCCTAWVRAAGSRAS
ncbi:hypothetical protein GmRootV15_42980 [Variovorax sp. V15]